MLGQDDKTIKLTEDLRVKRSVIEILLVVCSCSLPLNSKRVHFIIKKLTCRIILVAINLACMILWVASSTWEQNFWPSYYTKNTLPWGWQTSWKRFPHPQKATCLPKYLYHFSFYKHKGVLGQTFCIVSVRCQRVWAVKFLCIPTQPLLVKS